MFFKAVDGGGLAHPASTGLHSNWNSLSSKHPAVHHPVLPSHTLLTSTSHSENVRWTFGRTFAVTT